MSALWPVRPLHGHDKLRFPTLKVIVCSMGKVSHKPF